MGVKNIDQYVDAWVNGNEAAYKVIFHYFYPRLLAASLKKVKNQEDAQELVMNTLLKIWQNKHRMSEIRQLEGYLFGILSQEIQGLSRKKILITENMDDIPLKHMGTVVQSALLSKDFSHYVILNKLTPKQREIFYLSRGQEMSQQEIAESTGLSINTVNNHISTSLKILRKELRKYLGIIVFILITSYQFDQLILVI